MTDPGELRVFPFLGDPVAQARSPALYNAIFARHAVRAQVVPIRIAPPEMPALVRALFAASNVTAMVVTNPHKDAMLTLMDRCDDLTRLSGAVNAVKRTPDGFLEGAMLDGAGMVRCMQRRGVSPAGRRILVVGVGRAGRAIAVALAHQGASSLALYDRVVPRSAAFSHQLQNMFPVDVTLPGDAHPAGFDIVVNATALGTHDGDPLPFDVRALERNASVFDVVMRGHGTTALLRHCAESGIVAASGDEMLVEQIPDYLRFFGLDDLSRRVEREMAAHSPLTSANVAGASSH